MFFVPTVSSVSKQNISQIIHPRFGHVSIARLKQMARKGLMEGLQKITSDLEEAFPVYLLAKETKITRGPTTDVLKFAPGFMLQMDFASFNVENIRGFTSTSVDICSATSYHFGFKYRRKCPPFDILKFLVTTLMNYDMNFALI